MNAEVFAEWMRRQGHEVIRTESSYWYDQWPRVFQAFPYHWVIHPNAEELWELMAKHKAIGLRYSTSLEAAEGAISYHVALEGGGYGLEKLSKKARYDVRKGMDQFTVEQISFERLAREGWELREDTLRRQGRKRAEGRKDWERLCRSAEGLPGLETWAAIKDGSLTTAIVILRCENCCGILYQQSRTACLPMGVNNLMTYAFSEHILQREGVEWIFYGLHSLDAPASVDEFKFRMGYRAKAVRQRVVFHPAIALLFNRYSLAALRFLNRLIRSGLTLTKAEGMARFYLEGKRPLEEQNWPAVLLKDRAEILEGLTVL